MDSIMSRGWKSRRWSAGRGEGQVSKGASGCETLGLYSEMRCQQRFINTGGRVFEDQFRSTLGAAQRGLGLEAGRTTSSFLPFFC